MNKHNPRQNYILSALPNDVYEIMQRDLELVDMPLGKVLYESGTEMEFVYFPTSSIVSLIYLTEDGHSAEIAVTGREGIVGVALFMGGNTTPSRAVVQNAGHAYRYQGTLLQNAFNVGGPLQRQLLMFTQVLITQMAQTAVCNRHHSIDQQLCRWLLLSLDRVSTNRLMMTQDLIANMLGVRREGVTKAAGKLQDNGIISYHRGIIDILDRPGLENLACECYSVVKSEYDRILPQLSKI
ncbi:MAG: helix-turn-helix domain-containing protein [Gammaproteobacteria bacterium]|nr:MAG: helix-turn-helix domain-containing protein [Gammaproteobacteria bacterium]